MKLTIESLPLYAEEDGDCLIWRASRGSHGYPQACLDKKPGTLVKNYIFTRLLGRKVKPKQVVSLSCGNKLCINPEHIQAKAISEVQRAAYADGRRNASAEYQSRLKARKASGIPMASPELVAQIRAYPESVTHAEVARQVGLHHKSVSRIRKMQTHRTLAVNASVWSMAA